MKIGIDIRNIGKRRTGDEVVFLNLVKNLAQIDKLNEYFLFTDIFDESRLQEIRSILGILNKNNFQVISIKSKNKFTWNFCDLPMYLKKNPVDVYHTQYITPFFLPKNIKLITTIHDVSFNAFPQFIARLDLFFLKLLIPRSLKRADKIIAVSEFTKDEIIKYYKVPAEKIAVVYNALSDDFKKSLTYSKENEIRSKYNLPDKYILYLGTLQPRKNIPFLLEAFANLSAKLPDVKLVIVGNRKAHNFDKRIDLIIREKYLVDKVIFPGYIEQRDLANIYHLASVFAFPSLYEGFGIPMLEAMSQKVPVVTIDNEISREIAGNAAVYVEAGNIAEFSNNLYNLIIDINQREELIKLGQERVGFFSWYDSALKLLNEYKRLIKQ